MTESGVLPAVEPRRGWKKLILTLVVFVLAPSIPQLRALLPVDETMMLFVPAMAACSLVGWWPLSGTLVERETQAAMRSRR